MSYILIVIVSFKATVVAEFNDLKSCEAARAAIEEQAPALVDWRLNECFPKGEKR